MANALVCTICGVKADKHHIKTRGSGGKDEKWNLIPLCRTHHVEIHKIGNTKFVEKYTEAFEWFTENNWEIDSFKNKWVHYEE